MRKDIKLAVGTGASIGLTYILIIYIAKYLKIRVKLQEKGFTEYVAVMIEIMVLIILFLVLLISLISLWVFFARKYIL